MSLMRYVSHFNVLELEKDKRDFKMKRLCFILIFLFASAQLPSANASDIDDEKYYNIFTRENSRWANVPRDDKGQRRGGVEYATERKPASIWGDGDDIDSYHTYLMSESFTVDGFDLLEITWKGEEGSQFTAEAHWEGRESLERIARRAPGNGEWQTIRFPVRNPILRLGVSARGKEIHLRPVRAVRMKTPAPVELFDISTPIIIPRPKRSSYDGSQIKIADRNTCKLFVDLGPYSVSGVRRHEIGIKTIITDELSKEIGFALQDLKSSTDKNVIIELRIGEEAGIEISEKHESYAIEHSFSDGVRRITLASNDRSGLYWAWQTFRQTIREENGNFFVPELNIVDWPDYPIRSFAASSVEHAARGLEMKINAFQTPWWEVTGSLRNPESKRFKEHFSFIRQLCEYLLPRGGDIFLRVNPFAETPSITVSDREEIEWLFDIYNIPLRMGSRYGNIQIDDPGQAERREASFTEADREAYSDDRLLSHAWFVKQMSEKIWSHYPETKIVATPAYYTHARDVREYYDDIGVSKDLIISWTGPACFQFDFHEYLIKEYEQGIGGRKWTLGDNTPGSAHGWDRRLLTGSEKYGESRYPGAGDGYLHIAESNCTGIRAGITLNNELRRIRGLTISEFWWNASNYDAEEARQRAIAKVAGATEAVKPITQYAKEYVKIANRYPVDFRLPGKSREDFRLRKGHSPIVGWHTLDERNIKGIWLRMSHYPRISKEKYEQLQERIKVMESLLKQIEAKSRNDLLTAEYKQMHTNMVEVIEFLYAKSS